MSLVKVRCGNIHGNIPFEEICRRSSEYDTEPYFEVTKKHIVIHTDHFSQFVCSTCSKACDCIMGFPFGSFVPKEDINMTTASIKVVLCPSLYNIEDFWEVRRKSHLDYNNLYTCHSSIIISDNSFRIKSNLCFSLLSRIDN